MPRMRSFLWPMSICGWLLSSAALATPVTYLSHEPVIDGTLDAGLASLPSREFSVSDPSHDPAAYRLAYGAHFLYLYIELRADAIAYRDRAYQNGDGFTLVIAKPMQNDVPSDEFYVLACSAVNRHDMEWSRKVFWYYNVSNIFVPVSDDTKVAFVDGDGVISFELLLPWKDIHPYHPWLSDAIGFNLGVVKAVGAQDRVVYKVLDDNIGAENSPRRYTRLQFEAPRHTGEPRTFVQLDRNAIQTGDVVRARAITVAAESCTERVRLSLLAGEKTPLDNAIVSYPCGTGLTTHELTFDTGRQPAGGYVVRWRSLTHDASGETGLSILPPFDAAALNTRLTAARKSLAPGSVTSLRLMIEEIGASLAQRHPYETTGPARVKLEQAGGFLDDAGRGVDSFARQRGFVRMAYQSTLDGTLQPYVVRIPADYDPARRYPLLVYLHGSAGSERDIMAIKTIPDGYIALGPRGRGASNWYSWDNAQRDIAEAVASVKANFSIDERNVFLSGFSMGGYGVYRTYYESPKTYRGIAVFSGTPRILFDVPEGIDALDLGDGKHIQSFRGVPVFIFHGKSDMNVPYAGMEQFVANLESAGARVEFHTEEHKGHEAAGDDTVAAFFRWIEANRAR